MSDHDGGRGEYRGPERRSYGDVLTRAELKELAKEVADESVGRVFELLGLDVKDMPAREKLRANLNFLDELRLGVGTIKKTVWATIGTAICGLFYIGFKKSGGG